MTRLLLGFALLAVSWTVAADDIALYKVELIVFENLDPGAIQAEDWPDNPGTPPLDHAVELSAATAATAQPVASAAAAPPAAAQAAPTAAPSPSPTWRWLNDSELSLNAQAQKLNASQHYKTIVHVGWIQPVDSSDQGKAVHIYDGMELKHADAAAQAQASVIPPSQNGAAAQAATPAAPAPEGGAPAAAGDNASQTQQNTSQAAAAETPHILDGTFTLRRGHFLHVDVDLGYTKTVSVAEPAPTADAAPAPAADTTPAPPQTASYYVRMTQSRRIRNDELHYLDHPLFGVLFVVSPYQTNGAGGSAK